MFQGAFHKIGASFGGGGGAGGGADGTKADEYARAVYMLQTLNLARYEKAIKKAGLTDATLPLWSERALADARVPPGARLRMLAHLDRYRKSSLPAPPAAAAGAGVAGEVRVK